MWPGKGRGRRQEFGRMSRAREQGGGKQGRCTDSHGESGKGLQPQLRLAVLGGRSFEGCRRVWGLGARRASVTRRSGAPKTPCTTWQLMHRQQGTHRLARYDTLSARRTQAGACTVLESAGRQRREQGEGEGAAKEAVSLRVDRTQAHTLTRAPATLHPTHRQAFMHWRWFAP